MDKILVTKSSMPSLDEYINEIKSMWETHHLTNMGPKHKELQKKLEEYLGVKHVTLYTNGHLALENILSAYNFPVGSEVITTPFTFVSTTHAIVRTGLVPVFCDINDIDYTIDVNKIEKLITDKTVAILPIHVYGYVCNVEAIDDIAKKYNLKVIYDAAHSFGVRYKGKSTAIFGDASMFSFHATKVFNTIEGGAVCYSDDSLIETLNDNKNFGFRGQEEVCFIGGNAKMSEFQAAMGLCNLRHIDEEIKKRKRIYEYYIDLLSDINGIKLPMLDNNIEYNYAYLPVVFQNYKYKRDELFNRLADNSIFARKYFYPITSAFDCYKNYPTANVDLTPIAINISNNILTLPMYADLDTDIVDMIVKIIKG